MYKTIISIEGEVWENIPWLKGRYQISNLGRVLSLKKNPIILKTGDREGYERVNLPSQDDLKIYKPFSVHRLVAQAFIPNPDNKPQVNHINSNRKDNKHINLEWCTQSENNKHAHMYGYKFSTDKHKKISSENNTGTRSPKSKLNESQVHQIRELRLSGISYLNLGKQFGIGHETARQIVLRNSYKNI